MARNRTQAQRQTHSQGTDPPHSHDRNTCFHASLFSHLQSDVSSRLVKRDAAHRSRGGRSLGRVERAPGWGESCAGSSPPSLDSCHRSSRFSCPCPTALSTPTPPTARRCVRSSTTQSAESRCQASWPPSCRLSRPECEGGFEKCPKGKTWYQALKVI
jgi:hypothetical protein